MNGIRKARNSTIDYSKEWEELRNTWKSQNKNGSSSRIWKSRKSNRKMNSLKSDSNDNFDEDNNSRKSILKQPSSAKRVSEIASSANSPYKQHKSFLEEDIDIDLDYDEIIDYLFSKKQRWKHPYLESLPRYVPLSAMVDMLVDHWETEGY